MVAPEKKDTFAGTARFAVVRRLGHGGAGIVYEANDRENGVRVVFAFAARRFDDAGIVAMLSPGQK